MNLIKSIKLEGWYYLHDRKKFNNDIKRFLHILKLHESQYYDDCLKYYSTLDVKDKIVFDLGADFGTSPMFFLDRGAYSAIGFSLDKQYFKSDGKNDRDYFHYHCADEIDVGLRFIYAVVFAYSVKESNRVMLRTDKNVSFALKADCEGCEWQLLTDNILDFFDDWIVALHNPIRNDELYEYIKKNGSFIGKENDIEFAVYQKKKEVIK
jgi:hypothetical protein